MVVKTFIMFTIKIIRSLLIITVICSSFCRRQLLQSTEHGCNKEDGGRGSPGNICAFPDDRQDCRTGKAGPHPPFFSFLLLFQIKRSDLF